MAPFSDEYLFVEIANKVKLSLFSDCCLLSILEILFFFLFFLNSLINIVLLSVQALFWRQQNYYGVDLTPLHGTAFQGYFSQVSF